MPKGFKKDGSKLGFQKENKINLGKKRLFSAEHRKKISEYRKGKHHSEETLIKMSKSHRGKQIGEQNPRWKGGISTKYRYKNAPRPKTDTCEICGAIVGSGKLGIHFDHDHKTGKFRGWICARCNLVLGMVKDNTETLLALINYIRKNTD